MTAVQIAYSRTRVLLRGVTTVFLMLAGFFMIFFTAPSVPGISEVFDTAIAHADAPVDPGACTAAPADFYSYVDPGCGCGCGCGF